MLSWSLGSEGEQILGSQLLQLHLFVIWGIHGLLYALVISFHTLRGLRECQLLCAETQRLSEGVELRVGIYPLVTGLGIPVILPAALSGKLSKLQALRGHPGDFNDPGRGH